MALTRLLVSALVLVLVACSEGDKSGPEEIHWDRDVCELCKMAISDAAFVAEVRGGPKRRLWKFDDIGCAVQWLNGMPWAGDPATEIWVADKRSTRDTVTWLDARKAFYVRGGLTPMNYGFSAQPERTPDSRSFEDMTHAVLAKGPNHICPARQ